MPDKKYPCVVAIDPGENSAQSVWSDPVKPITYGPILLTDDLGYLFPVTHGLLLIEGQFVYKNVKAALRLSENAGRWIEKASSRGYDIHRVMPSEWQSACGIFPLRMRGLNPSERRKAIKDQSIFYAQNVTGNKGITEHEADAINIAKTYINKHRIEFL